MIGDRNPLLANDSYSILRGMDDAARLAAQEDLLAPHSEGWLKKYIQPGFTVMDVGCGHGALTSALATLVGPKGNVIAVDNSQEQLDIAQAKAKAQGITNIKFVQADVNNLSILREQCDAIHCRYLLIHVKDPMHAAKEMVSLVKPGGVILCEELGGDSYTCTTRKPIALLLVIMAVRIQHWMKGTDRSVAHRLIKGFPQMGMIVEYENPKIISATPHHKSRFREGVEAAIKKVTFSVLKYFGNWWVKSLKAMENDPKVVITQHSFYQIAAHKP